MIDPQDRIARLTRHLRSMAKANKADGRAAMNLQSDIAGLRLYPGYLDRDGQVELLAAVRKVLQAAPLFTPRMPKSGRPFTRAHVELRTAWLGLRRKRLPLSAAPSRKPASPGRRCRQCCLPCGPSLPAFAIGPKPASSTFMDRMQKWACIRTAMNRSSTRR